jgi:hypothetical protein
VFLVIFIASNRIEIITGKLNTAIKMVLLLAFEARPESSVSDEAKPNEDNTIVSKNNKRSAMGLLRNKMKRVKPESDRSKHRIKL